MYGDAKNVGRHARDGIQVFDRVVDRMAFEQRLVDVRQRAPKQNRVTIRPCACDSRGPERPARAADVFNHHRAKEGLYLFCPRTSDGVIRATRRKGNHEPDWSSWVRLRPREA